MDSRKILFAVALLFSSLIPYAQGVGIPSKKGGIGFGNLPLFSGIRFNFIDKNVEKISGINVTIWQANHDSLQTGTVNGISIGLPLSISTENKHGLAVGILGVGATRNLTGINIGGIGVGSGSSVSGINVGGLGVGSGVNLRGINIAGLGAGSGGDVYGINLAGLGVGAGKNLSGLNVGGLGAGGGENVTGISMALLGVGAGKNLRGISIGGLGVGAGETVTGITIGGLGVGAGKELRGLVISCLAAGSPKVKAIAIAPLVGGVSVRGLIIAPFHLLVGPEKKPKGRDEKPIEDANGTFKGISVSIFNKVNGHQKGAMLGVVNYARKIKGVQFGLINIVKENPKGLRILPIFNMRFGNKSE